MFFSLKDRLRRAQFESRVAHLRTTPQVKLDHELGLSVLTQLQHKDVLLYLAAIKSFARHVPVERVHVLDDGSLTASDRSLLVASVPDLTIAPIEEFSDPLLPRGGTWERLTAIARLSRQAYVVQLDADTLTIGPLPEVVDAVRRGCSFTIGTWDGQEIEGADERAAHARQIRSGGSDHVQLQAEAALDQLRAAETLRYVRGCSGFAGFAPAADRLDVMRDVSPQMERLIGQAWQQWGSEQVMSNFLVANAADAIVLPHPAYCDCSKIRASETRFVHFIGSCRFADGRYARMINELGI